MKNKLHIFAIIFFISISLSLSSSEVIIQVSDTCDGYHIDDSTPQPFRPVLSCNFGIPDSSFVIVEVHIVNLRIEVGTKRIKTIISDKLSEGVYQVHWDGTDDEGNLQDKKAKYIFYTKIIRKTKTIYGEGYINMEAKTKITSPLTD